MARGKALEEIYQKKTQLEHILLRPDTYIGSIEFVTQNMWIYDLKLKQMVNRSISFVPGLYKIFDEIIVNAADNKYRDPTMDTIKVNIDTETQFITVFNNGKGIPVEMHSVEGVYVPELIFGHLLTSSNYDDMEKKITGGRNGYGAKLCNIFSKEFIVETASKQSKKKFRQVFKENMSVKLEPVISTNNREDYTKISFKPDFKRFGMEEIDEDLLYLFAKRVYDLVGCVKKIKVFFNDEHIHISSFKQYIDLYSPKAVDNEEDSDCIRFEPVYEALNDRWEVCVVQSEGQFQQVSFVNSIHTYKGGTHVNYITDQIVSKLIDIIKKKNKSFSVKPFQIKNHLWVFINCLIENPSFDSQTKENMTLKASSFGSKCEITPEYIKKITKTTILDSIFNWMKIKQDKDLKRMDGNRNSRLTGIPKLDDANWAGTKNGSKCTLILTEGDSAKALAVSGLSVVGRDAFGVFPLRGKLLNVREAGHKQIMENAEINSIKQILGLQHGKVYDSVSSLRYGKLMIMTDQDHDGSHIKGLLINFIEYFWPSLLRISGFLVSFITPIVKVTKSKESLSFYTIPEYERWKIDNNNGKGYFIKYYKGLGTSTSSDAKSYFSSMSSHVKVFLDIKESEKQLLDMAFNKKKADDRKEWLRKFVPGTHIDLRSEHIRISDFINKEFILFSMADNIRSIPSVVDGLKPGLRKVLFACLKRKLTEEIKVAQLSGYVSEHSAYHHGDQSLCASIIGMAQDFVGSNNINLLVPSGQFGTRIQGGKDSASPRYIFTKLSDITRVIFKQEDDFLLNYLNDDGQSIEPEWYVPILPMILVNGSEGIGTGWSTFIPCYNPKEVAQNLIRRLNEEDYVEMHPWYRGFKGKIEKVADDKYLVSGIIEKTDSDTLRVTELPVGSWTQSYKEFLEGLLFHSSDKNKSNAFTIKNFQEYNTDTTVDFMIKLTEGSMHISESEGLYKKFKIITSLSIGNMMAFDSEGRIKKYNNVFEIMEDFYQVRMVFYQRRKDHLVNSLTKEWHKLSNKMRFIQEIIEGSLVISNKKVNDIVFELEKKGYLPMNIDDVQENPSLSKDNFDYLLSMPMWSLTSERIDKLSGEKDQKESELKSILEKTPKDLWKSDLDVFLNHIDKYPEYGICERDGLVDVPKKITKRVTKAKNVSLSDRITTVLKYKKGLEDNKDMVESIVNKANKKATLTRKVPKKGMSKARAKSNSQIPGIVSDESDSTMSDDF